MNTNAKRHMLTDIPIKFHDYSSNTLDTTCKLPILTKSRAITLQLLNKSRHETPGAQLHMLTNIPKKLTLAQIRSELRAIQHFGTDVQTHVRTSATLYAHNCVGT